MNHRESRRALAKGKRGLARRWGWTFGVFLSAAALGCSGGSGGNAGPGGHGGNQEAGATGGSGGGGAPGSDAGGSAGSAGTTGADAGGSAGAPGAGGSAGDAGQSGAQALGYTLDTAHAASASIDPAGGTLTATAADGSVYTLTVPAGALTQATTLTLTPLTGVSVAGETAAWEVGADLQPQGLGFVVPATLAVQPATQPPASAAVVLADKSDDTFAPMTQQGVSTASLAHFSTYLIARVTQARLSAAIGVAATALDTTASLHWVLVLERNLIAAEQLTLPALEQAAQTALAKAQAAIDAGKLKGTAQPGPDTLVPLLQAEALARQAGETALADSAHSAALAVFDAWLIQLQGQITNSLGFNLLPVGQAMMQIATTSLTERQSQTLAVLGTLVGALQGLADQDCNSGNFTTGRDELAQLSAVASTWSLSSPSSQSLDDDAATCYPPQITAVYMDPGGYVDSFMGEHDNSLGADLGSQVTKDPPQGTTLPALTTTTDAAGCAAYQSGGYNLEGSLSNPGLLASSSYKSSNADFSFGGTVDSSGLLYTLSFGGHANPVPDSTDYPADDIITNASGQVYAKFHLEFINPRRAPFEVDLDWQLGPQTSSIASQPSSATWNAIVQLSGCPNQLPAIAPVTLTAPSGTQAFPVAAAAASTVERGMLQIAFNSKVNAYASYLGETGGGATATGSASMAATLHIKLVPKP